MKVNVLNIQGQQTGKEIDLPDGVFGIEPNEHVVYLAVKQYLANQRQGTHKAKERGEIVGSRKKLKRQKGTGTARFGDIKNPIFRGGGRIFGPRPRNYSSKLNKKVRALARKSALASKLKSDKLIVVEDFTFEGPKTKEYINILNNLNVADAKTLLVTKDYDNTLYLSSRNVSDSSVTSAKDVNTYQILNSNVVILSESAVAQLSESFA